jgi:nucleoside-diphosphate-sugar epimerase
MTNEWTVGTDDRLLITGANGFIGSRVVHTLLEYGFRNLCCFVRPTSRLDQLHRTIESWNARDAVDIVSGDLTSRADCDRAASGVRVAFHLAAGFDKSFAGAFMSSVLGTRNLVEALLANGPLTRFVNVSSFAVYSNLRMKRGAWLDETASLEDSPHGRWDAYGYGKLKQEELVRRYGRERGLPYVILRPGTVFGPGKKDLTGRIGVGTFGIFMHIGGSNTLPLTFVDNCAEAIVRAGLVPGVDGETLNVVDDDPWTSRRFLAAYRSVNPGFRSVRVHYPVVWMLSRAWEWYASASKGQLPPAFNRRRCSAEWKGNRYSNARLKQVLGWTPRIPMDEAMRRFLSQFASAGGGA